MLPYAEARERSESTGEPLIVLVTSTACPACRRVERELLPEIVSLGATAVVSYDEDHERAVNLLVWGRTGVQFPTLIVRDCEGGVCVVRSYVGYDRIERWLRGKQNRLLKGTER